MIPTPSSDSLGRYLPAVLTSLMLMGGLRAGTISFSPILSDAESGISQGKTYTHTVDFNGDGATINGVVFGAGGLIGANYSLTGAAQLFSGNNQNELPSPGGDGVNDLTDTFFYGGPVEVLNLSGLIPSAFYRAGFIVSGWGGSAQLLKGSDDNIERLFDRDGDLDVATGQLTPVIINFDYQSSAAGTIELTFTEGTLGNSFHQYGFFNELTSVPEPSAAGTAFMALGGLLLRRRRD